MRATVKEKTITNIERIYSKLDYIEDLANDILALVAKADELKSYITEKEIGESNFVPIGEYRVKKFLYTTTLMNRTVYRISEETLETSVSARGNEEIVELLFRPKKQKSFVVKIPPITLEETVFLLYNPGVLSRITRKFENPILASVLEFMKGVAKKVKKHIIDRVAQGVAVSPVGGPLIVHVPLGGNGIRDVFFYKQVVNRTVFDVEYLSSAVSSIFFVNYRSKTTPLVYDVTVPFKEAVKEQIAKILAEIGSSDLSVLEEKLEKAWRIIGVAAVTHVAVAREYRGVNLFWLHQI